MPNPPIALVHGWGGSFATTWQQPGFTALLADAGRQVIGVDLLGHGTAPKPHDPAAYSRSPEHVLAALPDEPVDAVGFSIGALTLLRAAIAQPQRFHRLVLAGIGRNVFERDESAKRRIVDAIEGRGESDDNRARLFAQYAGQPGNDAVALVAAMNAPPAPPLADADLKVIECPVLVVNGELDDVLPADRLLAALPDAREVIVRRTDHFALTEAFGFIDATLEFLDAVPG